MAKAKPDPEPTDLTVGRTYYFSTCKFDYVGRLLAVDTPYGVRLTEASRVFNTGRFHEFMRDGRAAAMEIEPYPPGFAVGLQWVDWSPWPHPLPTEAV